MIGLLLAFYPAQWRRRYGEEFRAVLESRPLGPFDFADVLIGALDARLTRSRFAGAAEIDGGPLVMLRIGGLGAIIGGALWSIGIGASSLFSATPMWMVLLALGTGGLLVGLIGLSAFQAHRDAKLAWAAFVIPGVGALVSIVGLVGMAFATDEEALLFGVINAWSLWVLGLLAMLVGSILFAVITIRAAVFSRRAAQLLAVSAFVLLVTLFGGMGSSGTTGPERFLLAGIVGSFAASWIALGGLALRRGPIRAIAPA
jgi:hypothetical protein